MAVNRDMAVLTGTQMQRAGYRMKDIGMDQTAGSMGLGDTADFYYIIVHDIALKRAGFLTVTIGKNRMGSSDVQFNVRVDWPHMCISDVLPEDADIINSIMMESIAQEAMAANGQRRPPQVQQPQQPQIQQPQEQPRKKKEKPIDPSFANVAQNYF
jgi:hypothetical protein